MLTLTATSAKSDGSSGGFCTLMDGPIRVCKVEEWAFSSCATLAFYSLSMNLKWWTKENIDKLVMSLPNLHSYSGYAAQEVYLQPSDTQKKMLPPAFFEHPNIKEIDSYTNKAHGPNKVYLYRISAAKDFK